MGFKKINMLAMTYPISAVNKKATMFQTVLQQNSLLAPEYIIF